MSRYIDADRLKEEIDEWLDSVGTALVGKGLSYYAELIGCIEDCPTVDAVEVVRCRDCFWCEFEDARTDWMQGYYVCRQHEKEKGLDDYCSDGKRKEQEC